MLFHYKPLFCAILIYTSLLGQVVGGEKDLVQIGDRISNLNFKDIRYLPRSLADFNEKQGYVIVCVNTTCPLVKRYIPKLKRMEQKYRERGIQFISLNVNSNDSILEIATFSLEYDIPFPSVKDIQGNCVKALGVRRTPEVVLLDSKRRLRYRGRIDDQYRLSGARPKVTSDNLQNAIDAVLVGREVLVKETPVDGCAIHLNPKKRSEKSYTYYKHVEPIIRKHCQECHQAGTEAPFSLTTYEEVCKQAAMIAEVVAEQRMPPRYAAPQHGNVINQREMKSQERETVNNWVLSGMPRGTLSKNSDKPTIKAANVDWKIGKPDLIVRMNYEHSLPAEGYIPYKYVVLPHVFLNETWVEAIEFLPSNKGVVHHCNMGAIPVGKNYNQSQFLSGKVPGSGPLVLGNGIALRIPKNSMLGLQIHYTSTGKPEKNRMAVGFRFARGTVHKEYLQLVMNDRKFEIPPGDSHYKVSATSLLNTESVGIGLFTHMHVRGKDATFLAHYPDGKSETLLMIPNYSFDWQMGYRWQDGQKRFPKGTRFECIAHFDNSAFNPYNPDPTVAVHDGPQTHHEMMYGFLFYTKSNEDLNLQINPKSGSVLKN